MHAQSTSSAGDLDPTFKTEEGEEWTLQSLTVLAAKYLEVM